MSGIGRKMVHGKFDVSEGLQRAGHVDVPRRPGFALPKSCRGAYRTAKAVAAAPSA